MLVIDSDIIAVMAICILRLIGSYLDTKTYLEFDVMF